MSSQLLFNFMQHFIPFHVYFYLQCSLSSFLINIFSIGTMGLIFINLKSFYDVHVVIIVQYYFTETPVSVKSRPGLYQES